MRSDLNTIKSHDSTLLYLLRGMVHYEESCVVWFILMFKKIRTRLDLLSIPQSGGGNVKTFRWDQRLQIQNLFHGI